MYYEEKVIEGVLWYRSHPNDVFMKKSEIQMTNEILRLRLELKNIKSELEELNTPNCFLEK